MDNEDIVITVKNYNTKKGLSRVLHESESMNKQFEVQGPMGKGLDLQESGTHLFFAGGTGILTFIDLVGHLVKLNLNLLPEHERFFKSDFKMVLFLSFNNREEAIALELLEAFAEMCALNKLDNFQLHLRITQEEVVKQRWNYDFIERQLLLHKDSKRVYCCGPPIMSETFDLAFQELTANHSFPKSIFEVL